MDEIFLTVKDLAELKGCSERYIRQLIEKRSIYAEIVKVEQQGPGRGGIQYRIPLSTLESSLQIKYKRKQRKIEKQNAAPAPQTQIEAPDYESLTETERQEITFWKSVIKEWDWYCATFESKTEANEKFLCYMREKWAECPPPFKVSLTIAKLYRKRQALYSKGEAALADGRGKHKNHAKKLTDEMFDIFEYYYLDGSQKTASLCAFLTKKELERRYSEAPELPSTDTFERAAKKIPLPYVMYFRKGHKDFIEKCAPYIKRMYEGLESNDIWVADNHTFDVMVEKENKPVRLYLTAFMDVRSRKMVGWCITDNPNSDATIYALKKGIEKYGAPKILHTDNGREFLFHDLGGNGFRKTAKKKDGEFTPPTILDGLGIDLRTSLPTNARAKGIERAFETVKENLSKLFFSYTGGNILERPDRLKKVVKKPELLPTVKDFSEIVDKFFIGFYNKQSHSGEGMWGQTPDEVFAENLHEKRIIPDDKLNLMFMRYSKGTIKVGKNGITLKLYGQELQYFTEDLWKNFFGKDVYVRYSPDDLESVRVYDTDNRLICVAPLDTKLNYKATKEEISKASREKNAATKKIRNYKNAKGIEAQNALDAMLDEAAQNEKLPENINPEIIKILQSDEQPLQKAVGCDTEPIDLTEAIKIHKERKSKGDLTIV